MKIAFLTTQFPAARLGGIGAYTLRCAQALASAGHHPHIFTLTLPPDTPVPPGITLHQISDLASRVNSGNLPAPLAAALHAGGEATYRLALAALLCDAVRAFHAHSPLDLLEAPEYEALALPLLLDPLPNLPIVTHLHSGSAIRRLGNNHALVPDQALIEALEAAAMVAADALCAPSHSVVENTASICPIAQPVQVLGLPFPFDPHAAFEAPTANGPMLYVGRLEQLKGMRPLTEALAKILPQFPQARIRLVGPDTATAPDGSSMAAWMRRQIPAAQLGQLHFTGELSSAQLAAEYQNAAFVVIPSLFESYSFVACEALAAGRAIVVSSGTGAAEVAGEAALSFARGDSSALAAVLTRCLLHPQITQQLAPRALARARELHAASLPARLAFYDSVIKGSGTFSSRTPADRLTALPAAHISPILAALTRLTASLAGLADRASGSPGARLLRLLADKPPTQILLYGAGRHTARLLAEKHVWEQAGHRVIGLIDDHPRFAQSPTAWGLPIESLAALTARLPLPESNTIVILSTDTFEDQFWEQTRPLRAAGLTVLRLYH